MLDTGPAVVDIDLWRGSNLAPAIFGFEDEDGAPFPGAGSVYILTVRWAGGSIRKSTADADGLTYDATASELTWTPTLAESRRVPLGRIARYEIERRINGYQASIIAGFMIGRGGDNDDEP